MAWLALFAALALASRERSSAELQILAGMAVFQLLEPRVAFFQASSGIAVSIVVKLAFAFLLIGVTGGINSSHYLVLMVPVVAAATSLPALGAALVSVLAGAVYLSFLLFVDWTRYVIGPNEVREICLRVVFLLMLALLTHQLAAASRSQAERYRETAEQLAKANHNLREAEAAVRRSERLAALGQLTAGLAHELRNPLGTIKASAEVLSKNVPSSNAVASELAGYIAAEVDRTNSLVTRFLDFARPLRLQLTEADFNETADRAIAAFERLPSRPPVTIHRNYSPDLGRVRFDPDLIERVIYNLVLNAAQASAEGDPVTVKTRPVIGGVELAVIDRGAGIEPSQLESIFNPFFTTKPDGVGLGLAIVAKIVDEHGGKIHAESDPGQGSVFRVILPVAQ